jgi:DNA-binding XRE family transcriptional regulator
MQRASAGGVYNLFPVSQAIEGGSAEGLERVVRVVAEAPGLTYAEVVRRLHRRRSDALEQIRAAVAAGLIHEGPTRVRASGGARRSGPVGLFPEPPGGDEDQVLPLDAGALRALRTVADVTPASLARQLGVSRALVNHWEAGRQPMPAWAVRDLMAALEDAQTSDAPTRGRDARRRRELVAEVQRRVEAGESTTRYQVAGRRLRDRRLLEQARRTGELHEAPVWIRAGWSRHEGLALFPGPRPRRRSGPTVDIGALRQARQAAGWSQQRLANHLGIARTTVERWENQHQAGERQAVPSWATAAAAAALATATAAAARQAAQNRPGRRELVRAAIKAKPGRSRKAVAASVGYTRGNYIDEDVDALIAAGEVHERPPGRRGLQIGLYPGPAPAPVLTAEQLRALRERAGLTQRELGEQVGTSKQAIGDWERRMGPIPLEWQQRLREQLEALPAARKPARLRLAGLLSAEELAPTLLEVIQEHGGLTRFGVERFGPPASRGEVDRALALLEAQGLIRRGRVGAGAVDGHGRVSRGRVGYLPATP